MEKGVTIQAIHDVIQSSSYLVCLQGITVSEDCGCLNYRSDKEAYAVESKYGYSPEEIFCSSFYNTRTQQFFDFYRREMLFRRGEPNECLKTLARMERDGILKMIITREIFSLAKRAGCEHVLEYHGNIYSNKCPRCGQVFPLEYITNSSGVPMCQRCNVPVRPQVCLMGEMVDNQLITKGAEEISKADVLLVLGSNLKSYLCSTCLKYFQGNKLILINAREHYSDHKADLVYHGRPDEVLPFIYP